MTGSIFDIKEMSVHDGPGIRTTVFFKSCPLRCCWCHNPEGLSPAPQLLYKEARCLHCGKCLTPCTHTACKPFGRCIYVCPENCLEICGRQISASDLAKELKNSADILGESFGGFTFSGGEPLAQPAFLLALMEDLHGYHLCIETSGYASEETFLCVLDRLDYVIMDLKLADPKLHKAYTGVDNAKILQNFRHLQKSDKPYRIRTPLIDGITDTKENLAKIKEIIGDAPWEQLPENKMAPAKYKMLGMPYPLPKALV